MSENVGLIFTKLDTNVRPLEVVTRLCINCSIINSEVLAKRNSEMGETLVPLGLYPLNFVW
jgi:hypothetical protein